MKTKDFDVVVQISEFERARDVMHREDARVILELSSEGKIPSWALRELDIDLIRLAAK